MSDDVNSGVKRGLPFWLPRVLLLFALVDAALRLVPLQPLAFRGWEALSRHPAADGPFQANSQFFNEHSYGDLASIGNYQALRNYHAERFTTDGHGFRNMPDAELRRPTGGVLLGDSFTIGSGVSDGENLSARLESLTRHHVYNAGGIYAPHFPDIERLVHMLDMKRGSVLVYVHLERKAMPTQDDAAKALYGDEPSTEKPWPWPFDQWSDRDVSRLSILLTRAVRHFQGPNDNDLVLLRHLRDGSPMLFFKEDMKSATTERTIDVDYFTALNQKAAAWGVNFMVVLVPDKLTVYAPLATDIDPLPPSYLDEVERQLNLARIPNINLRRPLTQVAASQLTAGQLIYFRDDTHWNARGIDYAARNIGHALGWIR